MSANRRNRMRQRKKSHGMTLLELMLALLLSLFVLSAVSEIYFISEHNYEAQSALRTLQENARMTSEILPEKIKMAGFIGCARLTDDFPFKNHTQMLLSRHNKMTYYQSQLNKPGTDAFTLWQASNQSELLLQSMQDNSTFFIAKKLTISAGDILFISDCKTVELFHVKEVKNANKDELKVTTVEPLTKLYQQNAEIIPLEMNSYFIANTGRVDENHQPIYALYDKNLTQQKTELVQGVDQMQVEYISQQGNKLIQHHWNANVDSDALSGISLQLTLSSLTHQILKKNWYIYVALREI